MRIVLYCTFDCTLVENHGPQHACSGWLPWSLTRFPCPQGQLPIEIYLMDALEQVELQDNQLSGSLPAWGGNLTAGQVGAAVLMRSS